MFQRVTFSGDMMKISLSEICIRFSPVLWISSAQPKCVDHVEGNYTYQELHKPSKYNYTYLKYCHPPRIHL